MQSWGYAACVLLLCLTVSAAAAPNRRISNAERTTVRTKLEVAARFTSAMQSASNIIPIAKKLTKVASSLLSGFGILFKLIGAFLPEDKSLEIEMKRGFDRVVGKLDDIEDALGGILREMNFAQHKELLMEFHSKIGLMERKLKSTVHAPNTTHAIAHFKQVYDRVYGEAGTRLVTLIVDMGILKKAAEYTENHQPKMRKFMLTLISLLLKAGTVEVAYEKFSNEQRGVENNWQRYFTKVSEKIIAADNEIVSDWKKYFEKDVSDKASDLKDKSHRDFANEMYDSLKSKYPSRVWYALSYDPLDGYNAHCLSCSDCVYKFRYPSRYFSRNYVVGSSNPSAKFIKNVHVPSHVSCRDSSWSCRNNAAQRMWQAAGWPSATARVVVKSSAGWRSKSESSRYATRHSTLQWHSLWWRGAGRGFDIIYFG